MAIRAVCSLQATPKKERPHSNYEGNTRNPNASGNGGAFVNAGNPGQPGTALHH